MLDKDAVDSHGFSISKLFHHLFSLSFISFISKFFHHEIHLQEIIIVDVIT